MNMKCNKKTVTHIIIMLLIWCFIALSLMLTDHFFLRNFDPDGDGCAQYRLIPPSIGTVKSKIPIGTRYEEAVSILGKPNYYRYSPYITDSDEFFWDLQFGYQLRMNLFSQAFHNTSIFLSDRWLIFPGIMLAVAVLEMHIYCLLCKYYFE